MLGFITQIATVCAMIMQVSSMFKPWTVALAGNPAAITLSDAAQSGAFIATLNARDIKWPARLVDCVNAIAPNANLDSASYKDAPVTWTQPVGIPGLATKVSEDDTMPDSKTARFNYSTSTVPTVPANMCPTLVTAGKIGITVTVERSDVTKTLQTLESLITGALPDALQGFLQKYITSALGAARSAVAKFPAPQQSIVVPLKQYVADPVPNCETPPPATAAPSPTNTPAAVSGTMPFVPCAQLITDGDTVPFLSGARLEPSSKGIDEITKGLAMLTGLNGEHAETYDHTRSTYCVIGTGTPPSGDSQSGSDDTASTQTSDFKFAAFFYTVPRGSEPMPDMTPLPASAAADPTSCNAIVGIATLNRLHAQCVVDSETTVMVDGPAAEYAISGTPAGPPQNAEFLSVPAGGMQRAMAHILQRL